MARPLDQIAHDMSVQQITHAEIRIKLARAHQELATIKTHEEVSKAKLRTLQQELNEAVRIGMHEEVYTDTDSMHTER